MAGLFAMFLLGLIWGQLSGFGVARWVLARTGSRPNLDAGAPAARGVEETWLIPRQAAEDGPEPAAGSDGASVGLLGGGWEGR
jgi:hypothetical protein